MPQITCYELKAVMDSGRGDLEVRVIDWHSRRIKMRPQLPKDLCCCDVERQDRNGFQHSVLDVRVVTVPGRGFVGTLEEFRDYD